MPDNSRKQLSFTTDVVLLSVLLTSTLMGGYLLHQNHLKRIRNSSCVPASFMRKKHLKGFVTSVGDGDNFHFYHTPGGKLLGWGIFRELPPVNKRKSVIKTRTGKTKTMLWSQETLHIRLCGIDAPECAHFGKPAQPYSDEALQWLRNRILGTSVKVLPLATDQYGRTVAEVQVKGNKWYNSFRTYNLSAEMLRAGYATIYEARSGAEFNGHKAWFLALEAEAKRKKRGMFIQGKKLITPREYKNQIKAGK